MIKVGITGSLASGKTTASKILSKNRGPLFSADVVVKKLYRDKKFKNLVSKKFGIRNDNHIKKNIKKLIFENTINLRKLEKLIHPLVRKEMKRFTYRNKNKKMIFYEIPLLIESKLMKFFNVIIFVKSNKELRLRRFKSRGGKKYFFNLLNSKQISEREKIKLCDYVVVNEKNLMILKKNNFTKLKKN